MTTKTADTSGTTSPVVLVDGSSYLYRAFHNPQLAALRTSDNVPTGAIFGVLNMLRKLRNDYQPSYMAVVFDAKGKTFRHKMYDDYKANRPPMPDDLRVQIEPLHQIIQAMGLPLLSVPDVEADDVIGTLAQQLSTVGQTVIISTGDKDMAQLVNEQVTLINTMTNATLDIAGVEDKFGVKPAQIIDYLALMGDTSDNIPGVEKVGPKTAAKWLATHNTLENIIANADSVKGKVGDNLRAALEQLPLSKALTTIKCDLELGVGLDDLQIQAIADTELRPLLEQYELKSWLAELAADTAALADSASERRRDYMTISDWNEFEKWLARLQAADCFAFDTETTSINYMQAEIVGVSFAVEAGEAAYVPLAHSYADAPQQLSREKVLASLKPLLEDQQKRIIGQHLKYDRNVLLSYDISLNAILHDTMLQSYVLDSTATRHDMDSLAKKYLGIETVHFEDVAGKGVKQLTFDQVEISVASDYAAEDADITLQLYATLWPRLQQHASLINIYQDIELPLLNVLSAIERNGVFVNAEVLTTLSQRFAEQMATIKAQAYSLAGAEFNLSSPKQIQEILFEQQGLPVIRKTPKGQPSTAEDVLQELADQGHELPALIVQHRGLNKLKSTYTDKLPQLIDSKTGRVHTSYHQAVASTGRLSSTDPNLQNIPIRNDNGRQIRTAFVAPAGKKIMAADYSQIELRIMAHLSEDENLLQAFSDGVDVHRATAAEVFALSPEAVSQEQRRAAKAINFGLIYGMSAFGLAKQLAITRKEAQGYVDLYFERYPGVKRYMESTKEQAREQGYVETVFGRRLYLPDINARNAQQRQYAERTAINAPMQGTAADIIKRAMINVHEWLLLEHAEVLMIMQVHDELVLEVPVEQLGVVEEGVTQRMQAAAMLRVPLLVDVGIGDNWDEAH